MDTFFSVSESQGGQVSVTVMALHEDPTERVRSTKRTLYKAVEVKLWW